MPEVWLYDTSLRDGAQGDGVSFSAADKREIARRLDAFGIPYIEGGWPGSNPVDDEFFGDPPELKRSRLCAFGSTRRAGVPESTDACMDALASSPAPVCTVFGKTWDFHVERALRTTLEENLEMIAGSVRFLKSKGKEVVFDAEHFFDGYAANPGYAMQCLGAAASAGADWLVLCDTNGGTLPDRVSEIVRKVSKDLGVPVGIHAHNDCGLAAAVYTQLSDVEEEVNGLLTWDRKVRKVDASRIRELNREVQHMFLELVSQTL